MHPSWVQSAKLFWHGGNCFGPKLPCQLWVESLPMLVPAPKCVGAPHPLRVASCISAALNPPPMSPWLKRGCLLSPSATSAPGHPFLATPCSHSSQGHRAQVTASSPTQEGDSPLLFRDMTRQTHSQSVPRALTHTAHTGAPL